MTDTAIELDVKAPTPEEILTDCEDIIVGVRMCLKRISGDGVYVRRMEGIIDQVELIKSNLVTLVDGNNADYNELVEKAESLQSQTGLLRLRVNELEKELNSAADSTAAMLQSERNAHQKIVTELQEKLDAADVSNSALLITINTLRADNRLLDNAVKEFREMQPERLKDQNAKLKKTNIEQANELKKLRKELTDTQLRYGTAESRRVELQADLDDVRRFDNQINGEHVIKGLFFYSPEDPKIIFYPYIFKWGLSVTEGDLEPFLTRRTSCDLMYLQGADFHIQIRTSYGLGFDCKMTEFGRVMYTMPTQLLEHTPDGMDDALQDYHLDQLERLSPALHERSLWARGLSISDLDFIPVEMVAPLVERGMDNLMYIGSADYADVKDIKGMGPATFDKMRAACIALLSSYEHESGPISLNIAPKTQTELAPQIVKIKETVGGLFRAAKQHTQIKKAVSKKILNGKK